MRNKQSRRKELERILCADVPDVDAIQAAWCMLSDSQRRHFVCDCAEATLHLSGATNLYEVVETARRFADGDATADEMKTARREAESARYASWTMYDPAVRSAIRRVAWTTATDLPTIGLIREDVDVSNSRYALLLLLLAGELQ